MGSDILQSISLVCLSIRDEGRTYTRPERLVSGWTLSNRGRQAAASS